MLKYYISLLIIIFTFSNSYSQIENVQLGHPIYEFLHLMKVKQVIGYTNDDNPNLTRLEVKRFLKEIKNNIEDLSRTEKKLFQKYFIEFEEDFDSKEKHWQMFNYDNNFTSNLGDFGIDKIKHLYTYKDENIKAVLEGTGHVYWGQRITPSKTNSQLFDIGFRARGTILKNLGFYFSLEKGGLSGNNDFASIIEPRLKTNFKYIENIENLGNYDFVNGYLKYFTEPVKGMKISLQFGREQLKFGYGYSSKFIISGDNPNMDFLKFNFSYGFFDFTSIHASTVGEFNDDRSKNYTKYLALNKFGFLINKKLRMSIGNSIIYAGRGLDLAYLNPFIFYKFAEMSLQDRDNGTVFFEAQSNHIKNLELQFSFFMDENFLNKLGELSRFSNKTAYSIGLFWHEVFSINDLSFAFEYARIRPYTYSHIMKQSTYTSFGVNLGHKIGPNADEIFTKMSYNFSENIKLNLEYSFVRSGENVFDENGNLVKNVGGDAFIDHESRLSDEAPFLDGIRINTSSVFANLRLEVIRDIIIDFCYNYQLKNNITNNVKEDLSFGQIKLTLEF